MPVRKLFVMWINTVCLLSRWCLTQVSYSCRKVSWLQRFLNYMFLWLISGRWNVFLWGRFTIVPAGWLGYPGAYTTGGALVRILWLTPMWKHDPGEAARDVGSLPQLLRCVKWYMGSRPARGHLLECCMAVLAGRTQEVDLDAFL